MSISIIEYLRHIDKEISYLLQHSRTLSLQSFLKDETYQRAYVRSLSILGEACKKIPEEFRQKYAEIE